MPGIFIEENRNYGLDCKNAVWASDEIHSSYHACGLPDILCDADFVVETEDTILLIEYKNASIPEARMHADTTEEFNPLKDKFRNKIARKYYDSLHYLRLLGKEKPIHYVVVLEYLKGDSASRKLLRNLLKKLLPFKLQEQLATGRKLIDRVNVLNIAEWNADKDYGRYPFLPVSEITTLPDRKTV